MNLDDAFERILESLYRAMLDDAHWPAASALIDEACAYFHVHFPHDVANCRLLEERPEGRLFRHRDLYTDEERKTSPVCNEGLRRMRSARRRSLERGIAGPLPDLGEPVRTVPGAALRRRRAGRRVGGGASPEERRG